MFETGKTIDEDIIVFIKELLFYGSRYLLLNENCLSIQKKIWLMIVVFNFIAIWFTLNFNDINNFVKLKLVVYRGRDGEVVKILLYILTISLQITTLSIYDSFSSVFFFFYKIFHFFEYYIRIGRQSIYKNINYYYIIIETNDCRVFHLYGLLQLDGNLALVDLGCDMTNLDEREYRSKVKSFMDDIFTTILDEVIAKEILAYSKKTTVIELELIYDVE